MRKTVLLSLCLVFLCSCLPESRNPLSRPGVSPFDHRLAGVWKCDPDDDGSPTYVHFLPIDSNICNMVVIEADEGELPELNSYQMFSTDIGGRHYMNIRSYDPDTGSLRDNYVFAKYELLDERQMNLRLMAANRFLKDAVENGDLAGKVKRNKTMTDVLITAESHKIADFIARSPEESLFGDPVRLSKVQ